MLLVSAKKDNDSVMYLMVGEDVVVETSLESWKNVLFESFCRDIEEEVAKVMAGLKEKRANVEKEG
jgi:hypothetical protein